MEKIFLFAEKTHIVKLNCDQVVNTGATLYAIKVSEFSFEYYDLIYSAIDPLHGSMIRDIPVVKEYAQL